MTVPNILPVHLAVYARCILTATPTRLLEDDRVNDESDDQQQDALAEGPHDGVDQPFPGLFFLVLRFGPRRSERGDDDGDGDGVADGQRWNSLENVRDEPVPEDTEYPSVEEHEPDDQDESEDRAPERD